MPNRLINETSPYLLQHANNPVDWHAWGPEALELSKSEDKPILLSIGYSACHWCHVMERESFEDEAIAALMNENFISIKVDREERPDLDAVYMEAVQMLTGSGGWPMTVFLTPQGRPFYGGTYFPPVDRQNMPGFPRLLLAVSEAYRTNPGEIERVTQQLGEHMGRSSQIPQSRGPLTDDVLHVAYSNLATAFDYQHGGIGAAPKFPQPMVIEFLLRHYRRGFTDTSSRSLDKVNLTLEKMAYGGIYDQIGGGFHRYSTDAFWLVPHFEKMLYDNALLAKLYLHAYLVTRRPLYRRIAEETIDYVLREMTGAEGGFFSSQDADSEGVEGKFFVWSPQEIHGVLGEDLGNLVGGFFGLTDAGNFEGKTILNVPQAPEDFADEQGISLETLTSMIESGKQALLQAREERVHPMRDDKVLSSWNGLMLRTLAESGAALGRRDYIDAARKNADFLLNNLVSGGRLLRTYRDGQAKLLGYLEDYAFLADGLVALYEASFEPRWLEQAVQLANSMIDLFWDDALGGFYDTGNDHEELVLRPRDTFDNAQPCGGSVASDVLLKLAVLTGNQDYAQKGSAPLGALSQLMARSPTGFGHWLGAVDFQIAQTQEIAIIGLFDDPATIRLLDTVHGNFLPNKVLVGATTARADEPLTLHIPLLEDRGQVGNLPTAYVCQNYVCQLPVTNPAALAEQLGI